MLRSPRIRDSAGLLGGLYVLIFVSALTGGVLISRLGGLEQPYFYAIYTFAGISTAFFIPLLQRAVLTYGLTLCFVPTFFGLHPEHLRYPRLLSVLQVCMAADLGYVLLGHVLFLLARKTYFQELAFGRKAEELAVANGKSERLAVLRHPPHESACTVGSGLM
ncbi:MAG TPA: hypothetical protein PKI03_24225 [Pseudomonadota bacterium]|nr:hypothetical protein [Pseudomonadota bacterium]